MHACMQFVSYGLTAEGLQQCSCKVCSCCQLQSSIMIGVDIPDAFTWQLIEFFYSR
jgi:hypothetical protein